MIFKGHNIKKLISQAMDRIQKGDKAGAIEALRKAAAYGPENPEELYSIGTMMLDIDMYAEAVPLFEKELVLKPNHYQGWNNKAWCLLMCGRLQEALQAVDTCLRINPVLTNAMDTRARILEGMGRLEEAFHCYERELEIIPDSKEGVLGKMRVEQKLRQAGRWGGG